MSRPYLRPTAENRRYTSKFVVLGPYKSWRVQDSRWACLTKTQNVLRYYNRDHPVWIDELSIERSIRIGTR